MWGAEAGWWCGALAAALVLLALAARCHTQRRHKIVCARPPVAAARRRAAPPPLSALRVRAALAGSPADDPPQIIIVRNSTQNTLTQGAEQPTTSQSTPKLPKLPLPEQWIHKRPIDYKYTTIPRPLAQLSADLGADLSQESRAKKFSATRSPSLEKDEKSPFIANEEVFDFKGDPAEMASKENEEQESPGNLKRFKSVSTRLNMCNEAHFEGPERLEMQNSPRVDASKDKTPKFDFSPKLLDTLTSPRFFTPPETVSPMFFSEPSPKSVYYDTVRSPKFFPETPRDPELPQSPRALGDHLNRNSLEKPSSPRILGQRPSPKVHSRNKENYFTFEQSCVEDSRKPKKYCGRNSIERERFTPPADKDVRKYKRHNSCDTYKAVELNITTCDDNKTEDADVVDCCVKLESLELEQKPEEKVNELTPNTNSAQARRQRLKSISLDSDNAKIIEQNLGLPIAKQIKDQMNEAYKNDVSASCESMERNERPCFKFDETKIESCEEEPKSPDLKQKKSLRQSDVAFIDMPRFSPKEFEITITTEEGATCSAETQLKPKSKNLRNLTIDLTKRDSDLEKELLEFEKLYTNAEEKKVKTPTLKVKATSLDSSESVNLSLPQKKTLEVPQNSISVPNTPKRQLKRILGQKGSKHDFCGGKIGFNSIQTAAEQRRLFMKGQDSGIYLREHHANLMLYQPGSSRMGSRTMGSFDENTQDFDNTPEINICGADNRSYEPTQSLGSNLLNYKQNLSVSSTNLKTLPEGVPSDDFEPSVEDEKVVKKLHRRNSNQSLMLSTHSLQSSNCSLNNSGASCHNLATVRTSISNFSLNDNRQKKLSLDRRDSNTSINTEHLTPTTRVICSSNTNISDTKNCLLQRRGSNNSLTLNIHGTSLSRHSSNSSLNKDGKQKKGLLERRSSNTSLILNINNSNPQLSVNRGLSISNYNLNGSTCNLSRYNSNQSIDNANVEPRKGILERRSSNTSLTLNIQPQEPRDIEIDETLIDANLKDIPHRDKHRKSLSTENLIPKSYKNRRPRSEKCSFGSHDNLWSTSYTEPDYPRNLTYVGGDQENEIIYAFGRQDDPNYQSGFVKNITTKPLSPQSTSEDFRLYLANMQHLQNASSVLTRQQLRDLNDVFQNGYSKVRCHSSNDGQHCCSGRVHDMSTENPQMVIPDISQPCSEYQKMLLRNLHQEFWDMPTNFQEKPIVSGSHPKNRYKTILPNEHSRFILRDDASNIEGYINANFIKGHEYTKNSYIATQGPLQNTMFDFWLMVYQNSVTHGGHLESNMAVQKVVMLTNFIENNRQKCEKYFPLEVDEAITIKSPETEEIKLNFVIKNCGVIRKSGYTIRKLNVKCVKSVKLSTLDRTVSIDQSGVETTRIDESGGVESESGPVVDGSGPAGDDSGPSVGGNSPKERREHSSDSASKLDASDVSGRNLDQIIPNINANVVNVVESCTNVSTSGKSSPGNIENISTTHEIGTSLEQIGTSAGNIGTNLDGIDSDNDSGVIVYHYWFHNWADHKCPKDVNALLNLSLDVLKDVPYDFNLQSDACEEACKCDSPKAESKFLFPPLETPTPCEIEVNVSTPIDASYETKSPPTIIHCSAGIGRTGCLIAILNGIKQLTHEQKVDVLGIVCNMRLNRGGMVQNSEQYELIHKVLCLYEQACLPKL